MAGQVETIRQFIRLTDGDNIDEALALVTEDFVYKVPKTVTMLNAELGPGLNKDKFKEYHNIIKSTCSNLTVRQ